MGVVFIVVILFNFGTQLLIQFSLLLARDGGEPTTKSQDLNYIAAPDLNPIESATNSAKIKVEGSTTTDKAQVKLYINNTLEDTTAVNEKNEFTFDNVLIEEGDNEIKAKTVSEDGKESSFSNAIHVTYRNKAPDLSIDYPSNGQTLKQNQQTLRGKTSEGSSVTVNGFRAIVSSDGSFTNDIKLQEGGNGIKVVSTDQAGNTTEKEINVTFAP